MDVICEFHIGSISDELPKLLRGIRGPIGLLRGWDSKRTPSGIADVLIGLGFSATAIPSGVLVDHAVLVQPSFPACLHGFDELWVGSKDSRWIALERLPPMTSEQINFSRDDCGPFKSALLEARALFGLGDGCGLNVVRSSPTRSLQGGP